MRPLQASPSTSAVGRAGTLPSVHTNRIKKTADGRPRRSLSSPSALPAFLADLPPPALAAAAATAAAAAASAATRFALLSAVDYAVATRLAAAVAPVRDPSAPSSDRKRALLLPSAGRDGRGDGSRQGSRDLFLLPDRVGECVAGKKKRNNSFARGRGGKSFFFSFLFFCFATGFFFSTCGTRPPPLFLLRKKKRNAQSPRASTKGGGAARASRAASP